VIAGVVLVLVSYLAVTRPDIQRPDEDLGSGRRPVSPPLKHLAGQLELDAE